MAQEYDKIFKENFEELIETLAKVLLKIDHTKLEEIPDDSQYTIEKRPDFLKKVKADKAEDDCILQIEIQTTDPKTMIKRMLMYYGFLYHDYGLPVKQYVLYIGKKETAKMPTIIKHENLDFKFHLINIADLDHKDFLYSNKPEDIVISILCDFKEELAETIIETILHRLKLFSKDELELGKYIRQLEILSNLRNLQEQTIKKLNNMSFIYDIETDIRYQQGYQKAEEKYQKVEKEYQKVEKEYQKVEEKYQKAEEKYQKAQEEHQKALKLKEAEAEQKAKEETKLLQEKLVRNLVELKTFTKEYIASATNTTVEFVEAVEQKIVADKAEISKE